MMCDWATSGECVPRHPRCRPADTATLATLIATVPIAVVTFQFDPFAHLFGDVAVRWGTIVLVAVIVVALLLAGLSARADGLRPDDVAFIAIGVVPGAVVGGRVGYLIAHQAYYATSLDRLLDPTVGGLELGLAVVGGCITGVYVASLLDGSVGRWLHLSAAPILFVLGAGKLTMVLTGAGQGQPSDHPWATAYFGPGPWGSLLPALPSVPSQAIEGLATLAILAGLAVTVIVGAFGRRDGALFFSAIGLWAVVRALVSTTWRDPVATGGLNAAGLLAVAIALGCAVALLILAVLRRRPARRPDPADGGPDVAWPDSDAQPRF